MIYFLVTRSQEDGVVSVPAESSVSSSVGSVVHMVGSGMCRARVGGSIGVAARTSGVRRLETCGKICRLILHLSGVSHQSGHSDHWESSASKVGEVHVLHWDDEIAGGGRHAGHDHGEGE